jgi:drug/metabolite transporter superfamily protein YnfA
MKQGDSQSPMVELKAVVLFIATAVAEIVGCYLPYLIQKKAPGTID